MALTPEQRAAMAQHIRSGKSPMEALRHVTKVDVGQPTIDKSVSVEVGKPELPPQVEVGEPVIEHHADGGAAGDQQAKKPTSGGMQFAKAMGSALQSVGSAADAQPQAHAPEFQRQDLKSNVQAFANGGPVQPAYTVPTAAGNANEIYQTPEAAHQAASDQLRQSANPFEYFRYAHATQGNGLQMNEPVKVAPHAAPVQPSHAERARAHVMAKRMPAPAAAPVQQAAPATVNPADALLADARASAAKHLGNGPALPEKDAELTPPPAKFADGGTVPSFHHLMAHAMERALEHHVKHYAQGTPVGGVPADGEDVHVPGMPFTPEQELKFDKESYAMGQDVPSTHVKLPEMRSRELSPEEIQKHAIDEKEGIAKNLPHAGKDKPSDRTGEPRNELDVIEDQRQLANKDAEPSIGTKIGRALSSGLSAFGGVTPTDFRANDRMKVAANNAEADRLKKNYLGRPGEEAERASADSNSAESKRGTKLIGMLTGVDVSNMSAEEAKSYGGLLNNYLAAKRSGDALEQQRILAEMKLKAEQSKLDETARHNRATEGVIRQGQAREERAANDKHDARFDQNDQRAIMDVNSVKGNQDFVKASNAVSASKRLAPLFNPKHVLTLNELPLATGELANIAAGGPDQELSKALRDPQTFQQKLAQLGKKWGLDPMSVGYGPIIQREWGPYLQSLVEASRATQREHIGRALAPHKLNAERYSPGLIDKLSNPDYIQSEGIKAGGVPDYKADGSSLPEDESVAGLKDLGGQLDDE